MTKLVLDVQGQVTPVCSKCHVTYQVPIGQGVHSLRIHLAYSPKNMEDREQSKALIMEGIAKYTEPDQLARIEAKWESFLPLKNLMTVSLDDPERHRGAGHRHDPVQQLTLSADEASPGFKPGPIPPGLWSVTLSMHAIVTDICSYTLQVWEVEPS